jgi:single-stranded DNA-binding protein
MMHLNAVTLTGHVGSVEIVKVPKVKGYKAQVLTPEQAMMLNLESDDFSLKVTISIALNEYYKTNGEAKEETHWFPVESWGRSAFNVAKYVSVGRLVSVQGKLSTKVLEEQAWDTQKQEYCVVKRKLVFIKAAQNGVMLLDKKPEVQEPSKSISRPVLVR